MRLRFSIAAIILAAVVACATNPATGRSQFNLLSEADEIAIGKQSDAQIRQEMGVYADQAWQQYVSRVGQTLAKASHRPQLPWSFVVVDAPAINAFALPGGYIYVTRGILPYLRDEAELANVLGHEVAHVTARHGAQAYSKQTLFGIGLGIGRVLSSPERQGLFDVAEGALGLLFLKHGRDAELESDRLGVGYAASGGWDPSGMAGMLGTLGRLSEASGSNRGVPNFLSTHPLPADRIEHVQAAAAAAKTAGASRRDADEFAKRLDGLVFGDSREQGIIRGRDFLHPVLRIALRFPARWQISNGAEAVAAQPEGSDQVAMILDLVGNGAPAATGRAAMKQAGFAEADGQAATINGLQAYVGLYEGGQAGNRAISRAAFIAHAGRVYRLAGVATEGAFNQADGAFREAIQSFRGLSQAEADRVQPSRLDFHTVRSGETWQSIASSVGGGTVSPSALAIMNGADPGSRPAQGTRIRVVVAG